MTVKAESGKANGYEFKISNSSFSTKNRKRVRKIKIYHHPENRRKSIKIPSHKGDALVQVGEKDDKGEIANAVNSGKDLIEDDLATRKYQNGSYSYKLTDFGREVYNAYKVIRDRHPKDFYDRLDQHYVDINPPKGDIENDLPNNWWLNIWRNTRAAGMVDRLDAFGGGPLLEWSNGNRAIQITFDLKGYEEPVVLMSDLEGTFVATDGKEVIFESKDAEQIVEKTRQYIRREYG